MWDTGSIPTELRRTVLVLIPMGNTDNLWMGLLEVVWKVVEAVIYTQTKSVAQSHNVLNVFLRREGDVDHYYGS